MRKLLFFILIFCSLSSHAQYFDWNLYYAWSTNGGVITKFQVSANGLICINTFEQSCPHCDGDYHQYFYSPDGSIISTQIRNSYFDLISYFDHSGNIITITTPDTTINLIYYRKTDTLKIVLGSVFNSGIPDLVEADLNKTIYLGYSTLSKIDRFDSLGSQLSSLISPFKNLKVDDSGNVYLYNDSMLSSTGTISKLDSNNNIIAHYVVDKNKYFTVSKFGNMPSEWNVKSMYQGNN